MNRFATFVFVNLCSVYSLKYPRRYAFWNGDKADKTKCIFIMTLHHTFRIASSSLGTYAFRVIT